MTDLKKDAKDSVIVYSGGLDSTTLLYEERERIALALTFNYGSNHAARETACARLHCERLGIEHIVVDLGFMKKYMRSSLLAGGESIPEGDYADENMRSTVVPFRNGIMLAVACGMAEDRGLSRVLIANHGGDHAIYPDCRPEFVNAMDAAMRAGTYVNVKVEAPYTFLSKQDIVKKGAKMGLDYSETYSCYKGGEKHCGKCGTCRERMEAFELAGIEDPTEYQTENGSHTSPILQGVSPNLGEERLKVNEIFYSLQGEGYNTGRAAVFVRLSGCNLSCPFCDTEHEQGKDMGLDEIADAIECFPAKFVVITGGEPSLQLTEHFVDVLHGRGLFVAVETNGTRPLPGNVDWITLSPKDLFVGNAGKVALRKVNELKVVFDGIHEPEEYDNIDVSHGRFLQPCDMGNAQRNAAIVEQTIDYIKMHPQWQLSLQTHKMVNIP